MSLHYVKRHFSNIKCIYNASNPSLRKINFKSFTYSGPGPKYQLKTLVGYKEHCLSKYRNPSYTFGHRRPGLRKCEVPGPKYVLPTLFKPDGFSFGLVGKTFGILFYRIE